MTGSFQDMTLTVGAFLTIGGFIWGLVKFGDWLNLKIDKKIADATTPLVAKTTANELRHERVAETIKAFELHVARNFVSNAAVSNLDHRMEQGFSKLDDKFEELRQVLMKQLLHQNRQ